mmetsp:Transcript_15697/g.61303  ORF Transcript_15697/g.61303 Transcript_15697/m.61303 type:complete len:454 (-) Transcript_15697:56-1417(-)
MPECCSCYNQASRNCANGACGACCRDAELDGRASCGYHGTDPCEECWYAADEDCSNHTCAECCGRLACWGHGTACNYGQCANKRAQSCTYNACGACCRNHGNGNCAVHEDNTAYASYSSSEEECCACEAELDDACSNGACQSCCREECLNNRVRCIYHGTDPCSGCGNAANAYCENGACANCCTRLACVEHGTACERDDCPNKRNQDCENDYCGACCRRYSDVDCQIHEVHARPSLSEEQLKTIVQHLLYEQQKNMRDDSAMERALIAEERMAVAEHRAAIAEGKAHAAELMVAEQKRALSEQREALEAILTALRGADDARATGEESPSQATERASTDKSNCTEQRFASTGLRHELLQLRELRVSPSSPDSAGSPSPLLETLLGMLASGEQRCDRKHWPECMICMDAACETSFLPCGHVVACAKCAVRTTEVKKTCAKCRAPITSIQRIYAEC